MLQGNELLKYIYLMIDLLDRKDTYADVIAEKQSQLDKLGIANEQPLPQYPKINYKFSFKKFIIEYFVLTFIIGILISILTTHHSTLKMILDIATQLGIITLLIVKEVLKKRKAKYLADTICIAAVERVLEQNRLDELRVWKEQKQAARIKNELEQWREKFNFVDETIAKACKYADLSDEYCNLNVLTVFAEYIQDKRCDTIYECMMKYDEFMRIKEINADIDAIENQIEQFEEAFSNATREVRRYLTKRRREVEHLCIQQSMVLDEIEYNQETTNNSLVLLSLFE